MSDHPRPMEEVPVCLHCGEPIWGGKGDWWHGLDGTSTPGPMQCADGKNIATPKQIPAPLQPRIDAIRGQINRWEYQLAQLKEQLAAYEAMLEEESRE